MIWQHRRNLRVDDLCTDFFYSKSYFCGQSSFYSDFDFSEMKVNSSLILFFLTSFLKASSHIGAPVPVSFSIYEVSFDLMEMCDLI